MSITLYDTSVSGHSHRVRLFLALLGIEYQTIDVDMRKGEHKTPDYLKLSPLGQVPTLVDGNDVITDSTAALVYLAKKYGDENWLPEDPAGAAKIQRWLSTASGELFRGPVIARAIKLFDRDYYYDDASMWTDRLLTWMQTELEAKTWLAAEHVTIADIAMYSYLRVANEGEIDMEPYPAILRWLGDVEKLPGFLPMIKSI
ncbi:MAG: glutathione S-transferase family protein [Woeseiaceae bacterium]